MSRRGVKAGIRAACLDGAKMRRQGVNEGSAGHEFRFAAALGA
jgi:hypothetical protein